MFHRNRKEMACVLFILGDAGDTTACKYNILLPFTYYNL